MVLQKFTSSVEDTRLIQHADTLYKVKLSFKELTNHPQIEDQGPSVHTEIEEVVRAVIDIVRREKNLVKIQTEHFLVRPSLTFWKTGEKLEFQRNGKTLKAYRNVISLTFLLPTQLQEAAGSESSSRQVPANQQREENSGNQRRDLGRTEPNTGSHQTVHSHSNERPEPGTASHHTAHNHSNKRPEHQTSDQLVTRSSSARNTSREKQPSSEPVVARQAGSGTETNHPFLSLGAKVVAESNQKERRREGAATPAQRLPLGTFPRQTLPSDSQREPAQTFTVDPQYNLHYSLRSKTQHPVNTPPLGQAPSKSLKTHSQNKTQNNSRTSSTKNTASVVTGSGAVPQSIAMVTVVPTENAGQINQGQESTEKSATQPSQSAAGITGRPKEPVKRYPSRTVPVLRSVSGRGRPTVRPLHAGRSMTTQQATELRRTINRSTAAEERRIGSLAADSNPDGCHQRSHAMEQPAVQTFIQKDRHIIQEGEKAEELKLQALAGLEISSGTGANQQRKKRKSNLLQFFIDNTILTATKRALRSADCAS